MSHVELIPIFDDNYVFMIVEGNEAILVDPGDAVKALDLIQQKNLILKAVLVTHHHHDHIDGLPKIKNKFPNIPIYAPLKNKTQILHTNTHTQNNKDTCITNEIQAPY